MIWSSWTANLVNRIQNFSSLPNFWNLDSSDMLQIVSQIDSKKILLSPFGACFVHQRQKFHSLLVQSCLLGGSKSPASLPRSLWQPKRSQRRHQVVPNGTPSCPKEATKWSPRFPQIPLIISSTFTTFTSLLSLSSLISGTIVLVGY